VNGSGIQVEREERGNKSRKKWLEKWELWDRSIVEIRKDIEDYF
jgi:hypothetical protein